MPQKTLHTIKEASEQLSVKPKTLRSWVAARRIGVIRLGRSIRIPAEEIERLVQRGTIPAIDERA